MVSCLEVGGSGNWLLTEPGESGSTSCRGAGQPPGSSLGPEARRLTGGSATWRPSRSTPRVSRSWIIPSRGLSPEYPSPKPACLAAAAYPYRYLVGSHPQERLSVAGAPADRRQQFHGVGAQDAVASSVPGLRHTRGRTRPVPAPRLPRSTPPPRSPAASRPASGRSSPRPASPAGGR